MSALSTNAILQTASVAYLLCDENLLITEAGGAERLLPASTPALVGASLPDVFPALRPRAHQLAELLRGESGTLHVEQRAGRGAVLAISASLLVGLPAPALIATVTRQAQPRRRYRPRAARLVRRTTPRGAEQSSIVPLLLASTMHEMRTPLTVVTGYLSLLLDEGGGPLSPQQAEALAVVERNVEQIQQLTADLLDTARIGSGQLVLRPSAVDLRRVIARVIDDYQPQLDQRRQRVTLDAPKNLPYVWCDELRATQILMNLIGNASKYSPDGGRIAVSVRGEAEGTFVQLAIADSGIGIAPSDQQHVFSPFYRAANVQRHGAGGSGLGLYVTRALVEAHGGAIWLKSEPQVGTTFYLTLPQTARVVEHACDAAR